MIELPALLLALIGLGIVLRYRQAVLLFMGVEILIASSTWVAITAIDSHHGVRPAIFIVFAVAVAAAEAAVGLSIVLRLAHRHGTTEISSFTTLKD